MKTAIGYAADDAKKLLSLSVRWLCRLTATACVPYRSKLYAIVKERSAGSDYGLHSIADLDIGQGGGGIGCGHGGQQLVAAGRMQGQ